MTTLLSRPRKQTGSLPKSELLLKLLGLQIGLNLVLTMKTMLLSAEYVFVARLEIEFFRPLKLAGIDL